jgi:glycosyltransferase involved in cell wall biosynthesis
MLNNTININEYNFIDISKLKGINFLNICLRKRNYKYHKLKENPKITVIIPVFNCQKSIRLSITSILNQKMEGFEIILVNDNSNDHSLRIINKMKTVDDRIKIINNHKNMGTLYSRCIGALNAKGKFIFSLDNDDLFLDEDVFETIYNFASDDKYDIVEFKTFAIPNYHPQIKDIEEYYFNSHPNNLILHQPELGIFPIFRNNTFGMNDYNIWAKCIKTNLYQKSVNTLGKKRYSIYNCWTEDISIIFIIFNLANSFIFLNKYGIFHLNSIKTATFTLHPDHKTFTEIFLLDIIFEILKERKKYKEFIVLKAYDVFNKIENQTLTEGNKYFLISILQKIINYKYINEKHKILIKEKFSKFIS